MRNIVLVKVVTDRSAWHVPFGILYVADALEKAKYSCTVWHGREKELPQLYQLVNDLHPLFVGFSTLSDHDLAPTIKASRTVKKMSVSVVWGGIHTTLLPDLCLKQDYVDYTVVGEGEESVVELANTMKEGGDYSGTRGLGYKLNNSLRLNPPRPLLGDLDKYRPAWEKIDLHKYYGEIMEQQRVLPLLTSRGCPYPCGFCYNLAVNQRRWRRHSLDFVLSQAQFLKEFYRIDGIYFNDDNLFTNMNRAKEIINKIDLPYFIEIRADYVNNDFVNWVNTTKCRELLIGAESGSEKVLEQIGKDITVEDIRNAVYLLLRETDIPTIYLSFITGFPGEQKEDRDKTLDLVKEFLESSPRISVTLKAFTPYPGTPLWQDTLAHGFKPPTSNEKWAHFTREESQLPWLSTRELLAMKIVTLYIARCSIFGKSLGWRLLDKIAHPFMKWRWEKKYFSRPLEIMMWRYLVLLLQKIGLVKNVL